jgi:serine/threonine protein kinase
MQVHKFVLGAQNLQEKFTSILEKRTIGKYELTKILGEGAFGAAWKAVDTESGDTVCVKIFNKVLEKKLLLSESAVETSPHRLSIYGKNEK